MIVPSPTVSCDAATLGCLLGCPTTGPTAITCVNGCLAADSNPTLCAGCLDQSYYSCGTMAGCDTEYGCLEACNDLNCPGGTGACAACTAESATYTACHDGVLAPADCVGPLLLCFPGL